MPTVSSEAAPPGGNYFIVALEPGATPPPMDERDAWARLAKVAERVTLRDEEHQTIDLQAIKRD